VTRQQAVEAIGMLGIMGFPQGAERLLTSLTADAVLGRPLHSESIVGLTERSYSKIGRFHGPDILLVSGFHSEMPG